MKLTKLGAVKLLLETLKNVIKAYQESMEMETGKTEIPEVEEAKKVIERVEAEVLK